MPAKFVYESGAVEVPIGMLRRSDWFYRQGIYGMVLERTGNASGFTSYADTATGAIIQMGNDVPVVPIEVVITATNRRLG